MSARKPTSYWVWSPYAGEPGIAFVTELSGLDAADGQRLLGGEALPHVPRVAVKRCDAGTFTDALGIHMGLMVLVPELVALLQAAGARIQLVPLAVPAQPARGYAIVNVLDSVAALDVAASKLTFYEGTDLIHQIRHLALLPLPPEAPPVFHLDEYPVLLIVHDDLRREMQAASDNPGVFTAVGKWRNVH